MTPETNTRPLILLVDDNPSNLHVLASALKADYRLKTATSGARGLELASHEDRPQLILLDVMMPGMSGIEMMKRLREHPETDDIPVIFVSADTSEQSQLDGLALGADDYLTKPVIGSVLLVRVRNLLQRRRDEARLRLASHVFEHGGEAIMITDRDNLILEVNPAFTRLTGYAPEEVCGEPPQVFASARVTPEEIQSIWAELHACGFWQGEVWDRHKDGNAYPRLLSLSVVRNDYGEIDYHIGSFTDLSAQKEIEERILHAARHDVLTGLPNRLYLTVSLEQALNEARREGHGVAVLFIDLDRFKHINDTLGHTIGDALLIEVAHRLRNCLRESDLAARLGGDEFVVAVKGANAALVASQVADKIQHRLAEPYQLAGHTLHSSPSMGISLYPLDGEDADTLMKHADTAMYCAKDRGRNNCQYFNAGMNRASADRLVLENHLHTAVAEQQFVLHYQPQVHPETGEYLGVEALVRWNHPHRGLIAPDSFIPLAEETGLILQLGEWVLDEACRQLGEWQRQDWHDLNMAVNLSLYQLRQPNLVNRVAEILARHGLDAGSLTLEITESAAMQDTEATIHVFHSLRALGVELAIDDFGTGYSSLSRLKDLPIQHLKLDRSFVKDIESDPNDAAICTATIALAHALELKIVAEGVETEIQRDYLRQLGCDVMQGYLFSKPVPAVMINKNRKSS